MTRKIKHLTCLAVMAVCVWAIHPAHAEEKTLTNEELLKLVNKLDALTLVTPEPLKMAFYVSRLCKRPSPKEYDHAELMKDKPDAQYKVFVTTSGADAMKEPKAVFPAGTVILKQKFASKDAARPELYTGMLKREKGFSSECGDWEFFTVDGAGKTVSDRGKTASCIACHKLYSDTDFITKKYK